MLANIAHFPKRLQGKLSHCCFQIRRAWAMIYCVALDIPRRRRQRDRFAKFIQFADDVVTVRGAHEARFLCIRKTKQDTTANPIFREPRLGRQPEHAFKGTRRPPCSGRRLLLTLIEPEERG
jgi:hypothetical protein